MADAVADVDIFSLIKSGPTKLLLSSCLVYVAAERHLRNGLGVKLNSFATNLGPYEAKEDQNGS